MCPKVCKYRIFYTGFSFSPNPDIVVSYQVENLHEVTDFSVIVCLDSFRRKERALTDSKRTLYSHLTMATEDVK